MKKLLVILTFLWAVGIAFLFTSPKYWVSLIAFATNYMVMLFTNQKDVIQIQPNVEKLQQVMNFYSPFRTWFELGVICGTMLITALWTIIILRKKDERLFNMP